MQLTDTDKLPDALTCHCGARMALMKPRQQIGLHYACEACGQALRVRGGLPSWPRPRLRKRGGGRGWMPSPEEIERRLYFTRQFRREGREDLD